MRIEFGHGLRLVRHPEIVDVFQAALTAYPRFAESLERVPAHSFLVRPQLGEARSKPAVGARAT
jgi:hypothetical protein